MNEERLSDSLAAIAAETFRVEKVFSKVIGKVPVEDQLKYRSQFAWFTKKVNSALMDADMKIVNLEGQKYDPGMAVTPLNLDEYEIDEELKIAKMVEPLIMQGDHIKKPGSVILGRIDR